MSTIVVGVDGSVESREALRWALQEARLRDAEVQAVYVYDYEPAWHFYNYAPRGPFDEVIAQEMSQDWQEAAGKAEQAATAVVEGMFNDLTDEAAGLSVETRAIPDRRPARALLNLSSSADLLVIGSRGRGGFTGLLLGSTSQQCVQHAECPVVILPPPAQ